MEDNKFLGKEKVGKLLRKFAIPCVLSLVIQALYNLVDQIFISNSALGTNGNSATGVVYPLTIIALAIGLFIGDGSAACISINQGKNQTKETHKTIGTGITVGLIASLILVAVSLIFKKEIMIGFGAPDDNILNLAMEYSTWIIIGFPLFLLACVINPVIRADGSPKYAMLSMVVGAVVNTVLDAVFIFALHMGMNGAALATFIGQLVTFVFSVAYFFKSKSFKLGIKSFIPDFKLLWQSLKLGISSFLTQFAIVVISIVSNNILKIYMPIEQRGIAVGLLNDAFKVFGIVVSIAIGIASGGQPILGYNYGAKKYDRVKKTFGYIILSTSVVGIVSTIIFEACPQYLFAIFLGNTPIPEFGILLFRIYLGFILLTCLTKATSIFFQAVGCPVKAIMIAMLRDLIFLVPLTILLPMITNTIYPFYWAAPISDVLTTVVSIILLASLFKKMAKENISKVNGNQIKLLPSHPGIIITISRQHGAGGREIGQKLAKKLNLPFYDKEITALVAQESGLDKEFINQIEQKDSVLYDLYLSTEANQTAIKAQEKVLTSIADKGGCVIVGRGADFVLTDYSPYKVFIYAPLEFRKQRIMKNYGDEETLAQKNIEKADKRRAKFYETVSGKVWGDANNYNLMIDSSIGIDKVVDQILSAVKED